MILCLPIRVYADAAAGVRYTERFYKLVAFDIFTDEYGSTTSRSGSPISGDERIYLSEVENSDPQQTTLRSVIQAAPTTAPDNRHPPGDDGNVASTSAEPQPGPSGLSSNSNRPALSGDILEALGDPKAKGEVFGPKILDEISERWGRVLVDGLTKEQKVDIQEKNLVPENFKLAKAPLLNQEVIGVLGESVKNRDKLLEKSQNHLGLGIASLASFTSSLIENDLGKIDIIKKISDITQIFLDLHNENTKTRRKLVMSSLDKNFNTSITDVKRDKYLFGDNLWEKIRAVKTAERSGHHIRRSDNMNQRRYPSQQGNWRGPPRQYNQRLPKQGGQRRQQYQPYRRAPAPSALPNERAPYPSRSAPPPPPPPPGRPPRRPH
ncbi:unnamed protein product [Plutella xylostella]|uniref:(diamondback moth) hypothetical protein n=1 Tax=Plutella xylostella TaxID=51655 RepID=A0A8S4EWB5_PLUXY|nr:unnamed protein product [Plutella xylostella]